MFMSVRLSPFLFLDADSMHSIRAWTIGPIEHNTWSSSMIKRPSLNHSFDLGSKLPRQVPPSQVKGCGAESQRH